MSWPRIISWWRSRRELGNEESAREWRPSRAVTPGPAAQRCTEPQGARESDKGVWSQEENDGSGEKEWDRCKLKRL